MYLLPSPQQEECVRKHRGYLLELLADRLLRKWAEITMSIEQNITGISFSSPSPHHRWFEEQASSWLFCLFNSTANKADDKLRACHISSWLLLLYISPKRVPRLAAPSWITWKTLCLCCKTLSRAFQSGTHTWLQGRPLGRRPPPIFRPDTEFVQWHILFWSQSPLKVLAPSIFTINTLWLY